MKKTANLIFALTLFITAIFGITAYAEEAAEAVPELSEISFKNAQINEEFNPHTRDYTITLEDETLTPTLKSYAINGEADIFVTYTTNEAKHQTGIVATLEFEGGTTIYNFAYSNAQTESESANNYLDALTVKGGLGEVYPAINEKETNYKLYIPSDLTVLNLSATTVDVSAYCDLPAEITLSPNQETKVTATVTAANGEKRSYSFKIKRLDKTCEEVKAEIQSPDFDTLVKGELFYQKPSFIIVTCSVAGGTLLLLVFIAIIKRLMVNANDEDETDFFDEPEPEPESEAEEENEESREE